MARAKLSTEHRTRNLRFRDLQSFGNHQLDLGSRPQAIWYGLWQRAGLPKQEFQVQFWSDTLREGCSIRQAGSRVTRDLRVRAITDDHDESSSIDGIIKIESLDAKKNKDQQSDVDSSFNGAILEKFERLDGNVELPGAEIIGLAERHIPQHYEDIVDLIHYLTKGEKRHIVLVEGHAVGREIDRIQFAIDRALNYGRLTMDQVLQQSGKNESERCTLYTDDHVICERLQREKRDNFQTWPSSLSSANLTCLFSTAIVVP